MLKGYHWNIESSHRFPFLIHYNYMFFLSSLKFVLLCKAHVNGVSSISTALYTFIFQSASLKSITQKRSWRLEQH